MLRLSYRLTRRLYYNSIPVSYLYLSFNIKFEGFIKERASKKERRRRRSSIQIFRPIKVVAGSF